MAPSGKERRPVEVLGLRWGEEVTRPASGLLQVATFSPLHPSSLSHLQLLLAFSRGSHGCSEGLGPSSRDRQGRCLLSCATDAVQSQTLSFQL